MKTITNFDKNEKAFLLWKVLFMRYGTEEPAIDSKPIISMGIVAGLLHLPLEKIKWMVRQYFNKKKQAATI